MRISSISAILALSALSVGCPDREVSEVVAVQDKVEQKEIPLTINRDIDILFVIDNSGSMREEQETLRANFPVFINVLSQIEGGLPNVHLGVVSSDMGTLNVPTGDTACGSSDQGFLQNNACPVNGRYISDTDDDGAGPNPRVTNVMSGTLQDAFSCLAGLGIAGCGFEQHLEAMKASLSPPASTGTNAGFLRAGAYLAVVFLADEDDCSAAMPSFFGPESSQLGPLDSFRCFEKGIACNEGRDIALRDVGVKTGCGIDDTQNYLHDISTYVDFLKGLKPDSRDVIVAGIIGNTEPVEVGRRTPMGQTTPRPDLIPSCTYTGGMAGSSAFADPGIRLRAFFESFVDRHTFTTICDSDYTDALIQIAELLRTVIGYPCIEADLVDTDLVTPGVQPDCSFAYVTNPGEEDETQEVLPACDATESNQPCWTLTLDALNCAGTPTMLAVEVVRTVDPAPNTYIQGGCVVR